MNKSLDDIAESLSGGDVIKSGNMSYDMEDVKLRAEEESVDLIEAAYLVAEEIKLINRG